MPRLIVSQNERKFISRLKKEVEVHKQKLESGYLSVPACLGKLAIIVSANNGILSDYSLKEQIEAFNDEADSIAKQKDSEYDSIIIRRNAKLNEIQQDLSDRRVAGLVFIGHGAIDGFWAQSKRALRWKAVSRETTFLKQGAIEQRMCGHFNSYSSVPLGTFALMDQRNLIAATGLYIDDLYPDESQFSQVYNKAVNTVDEIRALVKENFRIYLEEDVS